MPCRAIGYAVDEDDDVPHLALTHLKGVTMASKTSTPAVRVGPMTAVAASRIQSATAKGNGGIVSKGSFSARAQAAAAKGSKR